MKRCDPAGARLRPQQRQNLQHNASNCASFCIGHVPEQLGEGGGGQRARYRPKHHAGHSTECWRLRTHLHMLVIMTAEELEGASAERGLNSAARQCHALPAGCNHVHQHQLTTCEYNFMAIIAPRCGAERGMEQKFHRPKVLKRSTGNG